ncbi:glycoside hydrolase superfamily [Zopfochytrium polystomum]|nr:glycoside hydrolase superfamily [Zopfochytrium polystomum]
MYKTAGLNCIRIYFHWGYHSPAEGVYHFDGNRDMDYLLSLCEELRLFVLAAPGPYICAETQGGGHPTWLIAKREVRLRHMKHSLSRVYDPEYTRHCKEWLSNILAIIARHQITRRDRPGCVIAAQVENENFENAFGWPVGLLDDMRTLALAFRECGITVPLFHNDGFEAGSFIAREEPHSELGKPTFGLDLYSFDKYVVFAPTSAPFSHVSSAGTAIDAWKPWHPSTVEASMDNMEKTVRGFGGCAATAPIFIAELQGGWFNHYKLKATYDTIYNYYGEDYTRMIFDTVLSQGTTALNYYMFCGGTNWGTLGDPDVYTSYDYSAAIREFGFISGRARKLRLGIIFARCFSDILTQTEPIPPHEQSAVVKPPKFLNRQRRSAGSQTCSLSFFRNFSRDEATNFTVELTGKKGVLLKGKLPFKQSFIGLGDYFSAASGLHLLLSTSPIHARSFVGGSSQEAWIIQNNSDLSGEMAFSGTVQCKTWVGVEPIVRHVSQADVSVVSFRGFAGWCLLSGTGGDSSTNLLIIALDSPDLYTLSASFEEIAWCNLERSWKGGKVDANLEGRLGAISSCRIACTPLVLSWGSYSLSHSPFAACIDVEWMPGDRRIFVLPSAGYAAYITKESSMLTVVPTNDETMAYRGCPSLMTYTRRIPALSVTPQTALAVFTPKASRITDFTSMPWVDLTLKGDRPDRNVIDLGYTSGHSLYRIKLGGQGKDLPTSITLSLDVRNRCVLYQLHGDKATPIGGHTTYSLQMLRAGAKNGPDPFSDWVSYRIPLPPGITEAVLVAQIESYGMSRQPFVVDDVRNGRGLLGIRVSGGVTLGLAAAGVDVRDGRISNPFSITGFPDELEENAEWADASATLDAFGGSATLDAAAGRTRLTAAEGGRPTWFRGALTVPAGSPAAAVASIPGATRLPLRLHVTGPGTAHVKVGGTYLARYRGNGDSVQEDFVLPEPMMSKALFEAEPLDVEVLVYGGLSPAGGQGGFVGKHWVEIQFLGWELSEGPDAVRWSGNLHKGPQGGTVFTTAKETLVF